MSEINYTGGMKVKNRPVIRKLGAIDTMMAEVTPLVYKGRLVRFETVSVRNMRNTLGRDYCRIRDALTGECSKPFGFGCYYGSAYTQDDTIYAFAAGNDGDFGSPRIKMLWSDDLEHWNEKIVLDMPGWLFFNTSVCRSPEGKYVMAIEAGEPLDTVGIPFTTFFAESDDLFHWEMMPLECNFSKLRYTACPVSRYADDGYYYMINTLSLPFARYAPYISRTRNFKDWEIGLHNPVWFWDDEDCRPKPGVQFTPAELEHITKGLSINNCDVDLCEFCGYTYITYATGDQLGFNGALCEAIYDGPLNEFLKSFFEHL